MIKPYSGRRVSIGMIHQIYWDGSPPKTRLRPPKTEVSIPYWDGSPLFCYLPEDFEGHMLKSYQFHIGMVHFLPTT